MSPDDRYLWDKSGDRDPEVDDLTATLASLRAPEARAFSRRRWWLAPLAISLAAAMAIVALVAPTQLPARVVALIGGERGTTAMMIEGGLRIELEVHTRSPDIDPGEAAARMAKSLDERGFAVSFVSDERIIAEHPGGAAEYVRAIRALADTELAAPVRVAAIRGSSSDLAELATALDLDVSAVGKPGALGAIKELAGHRGLEIDRSGDRFYAFERAALDGVEITEISRAPGGVQVRLSPGTKSRLRKEAGSGAQLALVVTDPYRFTHLNKILGTAPLAYSNPGGPVFAIDRHGQELIDQLVDHPAPGAGAQLVLVSEQLIGPSLSAAQTWAARALFGMLVGLVAFGLAALAGRRARALEPLVERARDRRGRGRVAGAAALTASIVGLALIYLDGGPFISPIEPMLLGAVNDTPLFALGYSIMGAGFMLAFVLTAAVRPWRRDLIGDSRGGRRLVVRSLALSLLLGIALVGAVFFFPEIELLLFSSPALESAGFAAAAIGALALVLLLGSRALGGPWLLGSLAVLATTSVTGSLSMIGKSSGQVTAVIIAAAAIGGASWVLLSRRFGSPSAPVRAPSGGLLPLVIAGGIGGAISEHMITSTEISAAASFGLHAAIAAPLVLVAVLLERRFARGLGGARAVGIDRDRGARRALLLSLGFFAAVLAIDSLARGAYLATFAILAVLWAAAAMDLVVEVKARWRRPGLRPAWNLHQPQLAGLVERALDSQGFDVLVRAQYLRTALGIFGAFVPMTVMVDGDRIDEARQTIAALLGCGTSDYPDLSESRETRSLPVEAPGS